MVNTHGRLINAALGVDGRLSVIPSDTDADGPVRTGGDRLIRRRPQPRVFKER